MFKDHEIKIERHRATGNGGQNVNKVESAIKVTHLSTGITAQCQDERDQHKNLLKALATLEQRVNKAKADALHERINKARQEQMQSGRVRTYDFTRKQVIDHRRGTRTNKIEEVFEGNLELLTHATIV